MSAARKAREKLSRRRYEWRKMHATKKSEGWRYKIVYPTWAEARRVAAEDSAARDIELTSYQCDWSDEPPPDARRTGVFHYHVGRVQTVHRPR